jgi:uncharacterized membrane protein (DUF4010 family)
LPEHLIGFLAALGGGLLIGIERERRKGEGPGRSLAGVRTFTLTALAGAIAQSLGQPWLAAAGAALVVLLIAIAYRRDRSGDPGATTEVALFVTYLLGIASVPQPQAAAAGAVVVAGLLAARGRMHRFATEMLSAAELRDGLILAGAALVLLPLLPDVPVAWLGGLDARRIWTLAVLIMALQGAGYVAQRWLGARRGLALAGLASGFVSSTATVAAMGARARKHPELGDASAAAALFSTVATFVQLAVIAAAVHPPSLASLAPALAAGLIATAAVAFLCYLRARQERDGAMPTGRAFNLAHATLFALGLGAVTAIVGIVEQHAGTAAMQGSAALAGLADAHAAAAAVLALAADGRLPAEAMLRTCLLVLSANTATKAVLAFASGGSRYGLSVGAGLAAAMAAAWTAAALTG